MLNSYVLKPASPDSPGKMKMQLQPMLELREWETDLKSTVQTDIMSDISAALEERLEEPKSVSDKYEMFEKAVLGLALTDESSRESAASSKRCSSIFTESPAERTEIDTRKSIQDLVTSSFAELNRLDTTFPMNTKTKAQDIKSKKAKRAKKHLSKRFSGSYFSPVETVISMLLFVRFFIPILTAPDTYDIDIELSPAHRRGLLLCAKVMAVLCNGMSFGSKEPCLSPMNSLIREYRPKLRRYLHSISSISGASTTALHDGDGHMSDDECSDSDSFTMDELASQFQAASVGAKVATNEERRKSKISLHRPNAGSHEVIPPMPAIPPELMHATAAIPKLARTRSPTLIPTSSPPPIRSTIDIPGYHPSPVDPSLSPSMPRASEGGEAVDNSMVSLDFLLCLETSMDKFESKVNERSQNSADPSSQHALELFRELKPVMLYTKHLTSPSQPRHSTVFLIQPQEQQYPMSKSVTPSSTLAPASDCDDREDRGHRRTSTLPESYKFS
ncbi:hypothetical protein EC988_004594 [Linderina pennispora]|nr:hypothetical protein EC988_004594 [Linderina pennispora]